MDHDEERKDAWAQERLELLLALAKDPTITPDTAELAMLTLIDKQQQSVEET